MVMQKDIFHIHSLSSSLLLRLSTLIFKVSTFYGSNNPIKRHASISVTKYFEDKDMNMKKRKEITTTDKELGANSDINLEGVDVNIAKNNTTENVSTSFLRSTSVSKENDKSLEDVSMAIVVKDIDVLGISSMQKNIEKFIDNYWARTVLGFQKHPLQRDLDMFPIVIPAFETDNINASTCSATTDGSNLVYSDTCDVEKRKGLLKRVERTAESSSNISEEVDEVFNIIVNENSYDEIDSTPRVMERDTINIDLPDQGNRVLDEKEREFGNVAVDIDGIDSTMLDCQPLARILPGQDHVEEFRNFTIGSSSGVELMKCVRKRGTDSSRRVGNNSVDGVVNEHGSSHMGDDVPRCKTEPSIGMEFDSDEAARKLYHSYAIKNGFDDRIGQLFRSRVDGSIISRKFVCSKEGFGAKSRIGCPAYIRVEKDLDSGRWILRKFIREHNHILDSSSMSRSSGGRLDKRSKFVARETVKANLKSKKMTKRKICFGDDSDGVEGGEKRKRTDELIGESSNFGSKKRGPGRPRKIGVEESSIMDMDRNVPGNESDNDSTGSNDFATDWKEEYLDEVKYYPHIRRLPVDIDWDYLVALRKKYGFIEINGYLINPKNVSQENIDKYLQKKCSTKKELAPKDPSHPDKKKNTK